MEHITSKGITVQIVGVAPALLARVEEGYRLKNPQPVRPTYEAETMGGDIELLPHDETTLRTEEDREAWTTWVQADAAWKNGLNSTMLRAIILKGVMTPPDYETGDWVELQEYLGVTIPTNPAERRIHYFETEVMTSKDDIVDILVKVIRASGLNEEEASRIEATFRADVQGTTGDDGQPAEEPVAV